ncbi:hypothetical protein H0266_14910 [Halobacillus locisalis]|uniref:Uncharacterized protein n=1 Tax=Halobacillus locisalis TaxID=220753 RepID=A0A838CWN4_9BACI|nr:hypothetical protein [Halobacillus locisalis]MBA2176185.1 hypothetical protein [Halobacillus locisalis]
MTQYTKKNEAGKAGKTIVDPKKQHPEFAKEFGNALSNQGHNQKHKENHKGDRS